MRTKIILKALAAGMVLAFSCIIMVSWKDATEIRADESMEDSIISTMLNMSDGFELMNRNSGRMLSLKHGEKAEYQKNGSKFDTYPADGTITERFEMTKSDKGLQFKNYCTSDKMLDVITSGTGIPKAGHNIAIYKPTGDDCSYWKVNYCGSDDKGIYINIESIKTPGLYIGHPDSDKDGTKRDYMVLRIDGNEAWCQWYVCYANKDHTKVTANQNNPEVTDNDVSDRETFVNRVKQEYDTYGGRFITENKPSYMHDDWCVYFINAMAKEAGCTYAISYTKNATAGDLRNTIINKGGKEWTLKQIVDNEYEPKAGDIVVYGNTAKGYLAPCHVGVVIGYSDDTSDYVINTIEGNTPVGDENGNGIGKKKRTIKKENKDTGLVWTTPTKGYVMCILEPNYKSSDAENPEDSNHGDVQTEEPEQTPTGKPTEMIPEDGREDFLTRVYKEYNTYGEKNINGISNKPGYMSDAWCAKFVYSMAKEAGCEDAIPSGYAMVGDLANAIINKGGTKWTLKQIVNQEYTPKAGDIIVFGYSANSNGSSMKHKHIGVIAGYTYDSKNSDYIFNTIEGNTVVEKGTNNKGSGIGKKTRTVYKNNASTGYLFKDGSDYWFVWYVIEPYFMDSKTENPNDSEVETPLSDDPKRTSNEDAVEIPTEDIGDLNAQLMVITGDANGDNEINSKDVTLLRRFLAGGWNVEINEEACDVNGDGEVNSKDVTILRRYLAGGWA